MATRTIGEYGKRKSRYNYRLLDACILKHECINWRRVGKLQYGYGLDE